MPETCFITGAAGFIGSHLVDRLLALGHRVIGIDNMLLGREENLATALGNPNFKFQRLDINKPEECVSFVKKCEWRAEMVWHMAANSDIQAGVANPDVDLTATFLTTYNTLKLMQTLGILRIAFASSSAIYGEHPGLLSEETGPVFPISNYGAMKLASEAIISAAVEKISGMAWIFRFPNVVGSRSTHGAIYDFIKKLRRTPAELQVLGDGTQQKPYLHVSELIDAMLLSWSKSKERRNCFNIGPASGTTSVRFIAESVVKAVSSKATIQYGSGGRGWVGDVPRFNYSIAKIQKLGWSPQLSSDQAVERAIAENVA